MQELEAEVRGMCEEALVAAIQVEEKHAREEAIQAVKEQVIANFTEREDVEEEVIKQVKQILE